MHGRETDNERLPGVKSRQRSKGRSWTVVSEAGGGRGGRGQVMRGRVVTGGSR